MRPSKEENYMEVAEVVSKRSHDGETQVGAVLVKNKTGAIVATGYNGFVRDAIDSRLPTCRPEKYPYMIHAEQNIITNCARHGISMDDCSVYVTISPCASCMRLLWQSGITQVICKEQYRDFDKVKNMEDLEVNVEYLANGYLKLTYGVKDG